MFDIEYRLKDLEDRLSNIMRVGVVSSVDPEAGTVRVAFKDRDNMESYDLPVLVKNTLENRDYWMPDIDEQVLCVFLPIGLESGFVLGSFYTEKVTPPAAELSKRVIEFKDGTRIEYDRDAHKLQIDVPESAGKVVVNSPKIDLGEAAALEPSVLGDKLAAALSELKGELDNHKHLDKDKVPTSAAEEVQKFNFAELLSGGNIYSTKNRNQ